MLTHVRQGSSLQYMPKKHISKQPLAAILGVAGKATRKAAGGAVGAGRTVAGWKNGQVVEYGPSALPLPPIERDEEGTHVRAA